MQSFVLQHQHQIQGTLSGFDRLRFVGTLRRLSYLNGLAAFLAVTGVLLKDFGETMLDLSRRIKRATEQIAETTSYGRVLYLASSSQSKEDYVRALPGPVVPVGPADLIAVVSCVEPCRTYGVHPNRMTQHIELRPELGKCLHYDFYLRHPTYGPMHVRLQTWLPFPIKICLNGRDWLAQQLDAERIAYSKKDNTFVALSDFERAQALFDQQLQVNWPEVLDQLMQLFHPTHAQWVPPSYPLSYYW